MHKLINISEATSIAIHSLVLIAKLNRSINATHIAELGGFSKNHLSKVLQLLVKQGYLRSNRGPKGGFVLIKPASSISLLDIYVLFEGEIIKEYQSSNSKVCPFENDIYGDIVERMTSNFINSFGERTIADIDWKENIDTEHYFENKY